MSGHKQAHLQSRHCQILSLLLHMVCAPPPHLFSQKRQSVPVSHSTLVATQKIQLGVSWLWWVRYICSSPALPGRATEQKTRVDAGLLWAFLLHVHLEPQCGVLELRGAEGGSQLLL